VNGTTGYEEAAGQGFMAGVNVVRNLCGLSPIVLGRDEAYMGVMIDDLVTKGTDEPYRMFTARAEHRLALACDLADTRLLPVAKEIGVLDEAELAILEARMQRRDELRKRCEETWVARSTSFAPIVEKAGLNINVGMSLTDLFKRQQVTETLADEALNLLHGQVEACRDWDPKLERDLLLFEVRYSAYREREAKLLAGQRHWDHVHIPVDFRLEHLPGLSNEVKEKFLRHRPETLGQASRIPGITPVAVTLLHIMIERWKKDS
jgi:tRNA uridine 5-carboxymethylaminomethyl modification enzyme